ncbi:MAG: ribonuclease III [Myxococcales bacterium]
MTEVDPEIVVVQQALGHEFQDITLLRDALTHSSFANEKPHLSNGDNERLEFMGDAVLQWVVSDLLWERFPEADAGEMTRRRADLVCEEGLAVVAREVSIGEALRLGKGEDRSGGREKPRLLSSALEACVAAVYLDGGTAAAVAVCRGLFWARLDGSEPGARDFKTRLQEASQQAHREAPRYELEATEGPDHERCFQVVVYVGDEALGRGSGRSKLEAEQCAAEDALQRVVDAAVRD